METLDQSDPKVQSFLRENLELLRNFKRVNPGGHLGLGSRVSLDLEACLRGFHEASVRVQSRKKPEALRWQSLFAAVRFHGGKEISRELFRESLLELFSDLFHEDRRCSIYRVGLSPDYEAGNQLMPLNQLEKRKPEWIYRKDHLGPEITRYRNEGFDFRISRGDPGSFSPNDQEEPWWSLSNPDAFPAHPRAQMHIPGYENASDPRVLGFEDAESYKQRLREAYPDDLALQTILCKGLAESLQNPRAHFFRILRKEKLLGELQVHIAESRVSVGKLYVDPNFIGYGFGQFLLRMAEFYIHCNYPGLPPYSFAFTSLTRLDTLLRHFKVHGGRIRGHRVGPIRAYGLETKPVLQFTIDKEGGDPKAALIGAVEWMEAEASLEKVNGLLENRLNQQGWVLVDAKFPNPADRSRIMFGFSRCSSEQHKPQLQRARVCPPHLP